MVLSSSITSPPNEAPSARSSARRGYIDWFRGVAILLMIEAHVFDSWTRASDRSSTWFGVAMILAGFAAPSFLFLAGLSAVLAVGTKQKRGATGQAAAAAVQRRGWEVFGLAFLFRLQSLLLNPGAPLAGLLKVDILNIMGPAIACSATVLKRLRARRAQLLCFALLAAAFTFLAPLIRATSLLAWLPDPVEWYLRPQPGRTTFTLFPWAGFLFAGSFVGLLVDRPRTPRTDRFFHGALLVGGIALALVAYSASFLPAIYRDVSFWTTSPTFFFLRTGILIAVLGAGYFWALIPRLTVVGRYGWLERFGRASLFVYWIHVEMVYGWMSRPLHRALPLPQVAVAFILFAAALFGLTEAKARLSRARRKSGIALPRHLAADVRVGHRGSGNEGPRG